MSHIEIHVVDGDGGDYGGGGGRNGGHHTGSGGAALILVILAVIGGLIFFGGPILNALSSDSSPAKAADVKIGGVPSFTQPCRPKHSDRTQACKMAKAYAYAKLATVYKDKSDLNKQFKCLDRLWINESGWDDYAENPSSGALGIPQALGHGSVFKKGEWKKQIDWGEKYIHRGSENFNTPCEALAFWNRTDPRPHPGHWY